MEFHQLGKWTISQLPEGGWQLEEQIRHEDQIGAAVLSSNLTTDDLVALQAVAQTALGYEVCQKCEASHLPDKHTASYQKWVRSLADYDNLLKRNKTDLQQAQFDINKKIISELLLLVDNVEGVLKAVKTRENAQISAEEQSILQSSLDSILSKNDVNVMFPDMVPSTDYDPEKHQAIELVEGDVATTQVVPLVQGYVWRNRVLRTAQVRIVQPRKLTTEEKNA